jgi:hypothetical protein
MKLSNLFSISVAIAISFLFMTSSCAKSGGNAPDLSSSLQPKSPVSGVPSIPTDGTSYFALVYGSSGSDRSLLANRIAGYQAPGLSEVFNNWRRISGSKIFNTPSEILQTPSYCFTGFDSNGNWLPGNNGGSAINPGTYGSCVNSPDFTASSWSFKSSPDRLYNAANGSHYTGFISGIKFKNYTIQATLSSADIDDDAIGIIIAAFIDSSNVIHTLSAVRTQGGFPPPSLGWGLVYRQNNTVISTISNMSLGGVNTNGSQGDRLGWNGRRTLVSVERADHIVTAYTSTWGTSGTSLSLEPTSKIQIDLSDAANGLTAFMGEQYYGYGTISQLGATFSDIIFSTPNAESDPAFIYDLLNNSVYSKTLPAGYVLVNGMQAFSTIGFPKRVKNTESSKEFMINSAAGYSELR